MGSDFRCQVETKKIVWLIGLVIASVSIIQYFELPYRDSMHSLLSSGKSYFDNNGKKSYLRNYSSPISIMPSLEDKNISVELFSPENAPETLESGISIAPVKSSDKENENSGVDISPSFSYCSEKTEIATSPKSSAFPPVQDDAIFRFSVGNYGNGNSDPPVSSIENHTVLMSDENLRLAPSPISLGVFSAPTVSPSQSVSPRIIDLNIGDENRTSGKNENEKVKSEINVQSDDHSYATISPPPRPSIVSISEMNDMLLHSRESSNSKSPLWPSDADRELLDARFKIENLPIIRDYPGLYAPVYQNLSTFVRSYEIMEQKLKIYIYKDGKRPVFHQPKLKGIYASEGWFMKQLEASNKFLTRNPKEAHLFYLPFSSQLLVDYVYVRDSHTFNDIHNYLKNYLGTIKTRYPFWNRTDGGDHFLVACHDWAPVETRQLMANCIRALCNSDIKEGFQFGKDVSLPETYIHSPQNPMKETGGMPPNKRKILAFFAGQMHGYLRPILLQHWEDKDPDMKILGRMRKGYVWHMKNSKFCICAKGYEVNSPRVVEAILYGCVPVIISDGFVPPFFDVLKWDSFAVFVLEKDIPNLKNILVSISEKRYVLMQRRVKMVRKHFVWHNTPVKYDIFHMILHSVWYNRILSCKE